MKINSFHSWLRIPSTLRAAVPVGLAIFSALFSIQTVHAEGECFTDWFNGCSIQTSANTNIGLSTNGSATITGGGGGGLLSNFETNGFGCSWDCLYTTGQKFNVPKAGYYSFNATSEDQVGVIVKGTGCGNRNPVACDLGSTVNLNAYLDTGSYIVLIGAGYPYSYIHVPPPTGYSLSISADWAFPPNTQDYYLGPLLYDKPCDPSTTTCLQGSTLNYNAPPLEQSLNVPPGYPSSVTANAQWVTSYGNQTFSLRDRNTVYVYDQDGNSLRNFTVSDSANVRSITASVGYLAVATDQSIGSQINVWKMYDTSQALVGTVIKSPQIPKTMSISKDGATSYLFATFYNSSSIYKTFVDPPVCGNQIVESGEQCDKGDANGTDAACCSDECQFRSGHTCRAADGTCDVAEVCTNSSANCPDDSVRPDGYECRSAAGVCDLAESCNGVAKTCPVLDAKKADGTTCGTLYTNSSCNAVCDGISNSCGAGPSPCCGNNSLESPSETCEAGVADCSGSDACNSSCICYSTVACGNSTEEEPEQCDTGGARSDTTPNACRTDCTNPRCGDGVTDSNNNETCDLGVNNGAAGSCCSLTCTLRTSSYTCRAADGICDAAEVCDGSSPTCGLDYVKANTETCREAAGVCDSEEKCTGSSTTCPSDTKQPSGTSCRATNGVCDVAETCTGSSNNCPDDAYKSSLESCRASAGECDLQENCTGDSPSCPTNEYRPADTYICRTAAGVCDRAEKCSGESVDCPLDGKEASGTECRVAAGVCDQAETCSGSSNNCPSDAKKSSSTVCRAVASGAACDVAEHCTGSATSCPTDTFRASSYVCRAAGGVCDTAENCTGSSASCPGDAVVAATTICNLSTNACYQSARCDGVNKSCPALLKICYDVTQYYAPFDYTTVSVFGSVTPSNTQTTTTVPTPVLNQVTTTPTVENVTQPTYTTNSQTTQQVDQTVQQPSTPEAVSQPSTPPEPPAPAPSTTSQAFYFVKAPVELSQQFMDALREFLKRNIQQGPVPIFGQAANTPVNLNEIQP